MKPYHQNDRDDGNDAEAICEALGARIGDLAGGWVSGQFSSGGKARHGHIPKRGEAYLCTLLAHRARAVMRQLVRHAQCPEPLGDGAAKTPRLQQGRAGAGDGLAGTGEPKEALELDI